MSAPEADPTPETQAEIEAAAERVMAAIQPRRRARPRLAEPLREAEDQAVETPFGAIMAWRLDPWGGSRSTPATLLVHGWEDDNALWGPLIERLIELGRPIIAFDLPGHGFSPAEECSIGRAAVAARAVAEALGPIDSVVGHSFGCPILTRALADGLPARRAVLMASPMPSAKQAARWERIKTAMNVSGAVLERVMTLSTEKEAMFPPFDYEALARGMTAQALFIHSLDDEDCEPENSRTLADAWPGAALTWVDGLGHRGLAQDPATLQGVADFLERA